MPHNTHNLRIMGIKTHSSKTSQVLITCSKDSTLWNMIASFKCEICSNTRKEEMPSWLYSESFSVAGSCPWPSHSHLTTRRAARKVSRINTQLPYPRAVWRFQLIKVMPQFVWQFTQLTVGLLTVLYLPVLFHLGSVCECHTAYSWETVYRHAYFFYFCFSTFFFFKTFPKNLFLFFFVNL